MNNTKPARITDATVETKYKVEKNVPIPEHRKNAKYPLLSMEVGDSFAAPVTEAKNIRSAIGRLQRTTSRAYHFITRTVTGRGRAGKQIRVWRTTS